MATARPSVFLELEALPPEEEKEATRDWMELPHDALLAVLHWLDNVDVLTVAGQVCVPGARTYPMKQLILLRVKRAFAKW
jgi:hypothetical protein